MRAGDLGSYLDEVVYPALFERLDVAFPEFGWRRAGNHWTATTWPPTLPYSVNHELPDRLMVYPDRPWWLKVHGHSGVRWLDLVNGGRRPAGVDFPAAARALCERAGLPFPERSLSPEEQERARRREGRRALLHTVIAYLQEGLWSSAGEAARAFLHGRGFTDDEIRGLGFGLYRSAAEVRRALLDDGHPLEVIDESGVGWSRLEGYIILPWHDAHGHPLTLYGRWVGEPSSGTPKTIALPGEGTKASPLFFDRARRAGHKDLVVVEGLFDAALAQVRGDSRVVAGVAAQLSGAQVETLCRHQIASVTICLDPDGGGERGTLACVESLDRAGIVPYVAPRLPDGVDPDDLIRRDGIDAWRRHLEGAVHGYRYRAQRIVSVHRGPQSWTDVGQEHAIAEAVTFAASRPVGRTDPLARYFWPALADAMPELDVAAVQARVLARTRSTGTDAPGATNRRSSTEGRGQRWQRGAAESPSSGVAVLTRLVDVAPRVINWKWRGRIAAGKLTLLVGDPGQGKSLVVIDVISRITTGTVWPASETPAPLSSVILLTAEDALDDTIRPRLDAAGADVARVTALTAIRRDDREDHFSLADDLPALEAAIRDTGAELVIIDPLSAYFGIARDSYKDTEVRSILAPLVALAERTGVAVVAVAHLNKRQDTKALYRVLGSVSFIAAVRGALAVVRDPADPERRLVGGIKANNAREAPTLAFRVVSSDPSDPDAAPRLEWGSQEVDGVSVAELLEARAASEEDRETRTAAEEFLRERLRDGSLLSAELFKEAKRQGIGRSALFRAKARLGIRARHVGRPGEPSAWWWDPPTKSTAKSSTKSTGGKTQDSSDPWDSSENGPRKPEESQESQGSYSPPPKGERYSSADSSEASPTAPCQPVASAHSEACDCPECVGPGEAWHP